MKTQTGATFDHAKLDRFVGTWKTSGEVKGDSLEASTKYEAMDIYEWLAGGIFRIHRWDADMPSGNTKGIEIIGFDPDNKGFSMQSFDSEGGKNTMQATVQDDQWTFLGDGVRFVGRFQESGNVFAGACG